MQSLCAQCDVSHFQLVLCASGSTSSTCELCYMFKLSLAKHRISELANNVAGTNDAEQGSLVGSCRAVSLRIPVAEQ